MRYADNLPFDLADVGQWWGTDPREKKQIQIDIVGVPVQESNEKIAEYLMGACKFKNEKIGLNELELLERYATIFAKGEKYYYIIFSLGGFTEELLAVAHERNVMLLTLEDLYNYFNRML